MSKTEIDKNFEQAKNILLAFERLSKEQPDSYEEHVARLQGLGFLYQRLETLKTLELERTSETSKDDLADDVNL